MAYICSINEQQHAMNRQRPTFTNDQLLDMLKAEVAKTGAGVWSDRRKAIEEMLRMRGVTPKV